MSVLFIVQDRYQDDNHFPLNIGYLSAVLKKHGYSVKIYSQDIFHYTNIQLAIYLQKHDFDIIGISFLAARYSETIKPLCQVVNNYKKNAWLVLGGHGPSPVPIFMLKDTKADIIAIGEAEETILELLHAKFNNKSLSQIKGIAYKDKEQYRINERRFPIQDLDSIPFPEWELFFMEKYSTCLKYPGMDKKDKLFPILTSRGCLNKCTFCYRMENGMRLRSIENVVNEIFILHNLYDITYFNIYDEMFGWPKKRIFEFRDKLEAYNLNIKYFCAARVDSMDKETLQALKDSGCQMLNFGLESMDQNVLNLMNKHTTIEENEKIVQLAKEMGFHIGLNLLWGNKGDTQESLQKALRFIKKYNTYSQLRTIRPPTPYPGCELYYEAIEKGYLKGAKDFFEKFKNSDLLTVNFTEYSDQKFYQLLYNANMELIYDYFENTTKEYEKAYQLGSQYCELYFGQNYKFRGARHYGSS